MSRIYRSNDGFTLLEVLVALVVMSIGLLGIGKLMFFRSRANDSAYLRSQATALAYSILDDMRSNRATAQTSGYNAALGAYSNPGVNCTTAVCTTTSLAQYELYQWKSQLVTGLGPNGDGSVSTTTGNDAVTGTSVTTATISVQWNDAVAQQTFGVANGTTMIVTLETVL